MTWLAFCADPAHAQVRDLIGYLQLQNSLPPGTMPTGAGVRVAQVEALIGSNYLPDISLFPGKTFYYGSEPAPHDTPPPAPFDSGHATAVADLYYGALSVAPGVTHVDLFAARNSGGWLFGDYLHAFAPGDPPGLAPDISPARVANHSWISTGGYVDILRRVDYVVERDDFIQVAAANNGSGASNLLLPSFNSIIVGLTNGAHSISATTDADGLYQPSRTKPDIVAPHGATSFATPLVAGAVALLIDAGNSHSSWSHGSYTVAGVGVIQHATTSEVIKSVLMAGADRIIHNGTGAEISNYSRSTANGLDPTFGAGQVNVFNSYNILAAGEQEAGVVLSTGWDYVDDFSGLTQNNYDFILTSDSLLSASLVWNVLISPAGQASDRLNNLDLELFDLTNGQSVQFSNSTVDNTENIWAQLLAGSYRLQVTPLGTFAPQDYALAWMATPVPEPGVLLLLLAPVAVLCWRRFRQPLRL